MALISTHQLKGSCSTFLSAPSSWSRESKVNQFLPPFDPVGRKDRLISLKCRPCLRLELLRVQPVISVNRYHHCCSVGTSLAHSQKSKSFKIYAFKGSSHHEGSKSSNNHVKFSYLQHESEEPLVDSSKAQNIVPALYTVSDDTATRLTAIQDLFKKWLMLLRMLSKTQEVDGALGEPSPMETLKMPYTLPKQEKTKILKPVWCYFWGLDATINIPLLIFPSMYIAVNILYGSEVSKELTPLWIIGPPIMALYVKFFRAICSLYVFTFKQTIKIVENLPAYSMLVYEYFFHGKLKEATQIYPWQPLADIKNMNYKVFAKRKMKHFQEWLNERYLDFIELIWPSYSRTIRFLKRANLI